MLSARGQRGAVGKADRVLVVAAGATVVAYAGVCVAYFWRAVR